MGEKVTYVDFNENLVKSVFKEAKDDWVNWEAT